METVVECCGKPESQCRCILEAAFAHDKARNLPARRPERVEEVLWDWACNHDDLDIKKVMEELRHLYSEQFAHEESMQLSSGNR